MEGGIRIRRVHPKWLRPPMVVQRHQLNGIVKVPAVEVYPLVVEVYPFVAEGGHFRSSTPHPKN